jgi:hypothetical protein
MISELDEKVEQVMGSERNLRCEVLWKKWVVNYDYHLW